VDQLAASQQHPRHANQKALVATELIKMLQIRRQGLRWGNVIGVTAIAPEIG